MAAVIAARARAFLERQRVARLATTSGAGEPHVVPICFALIAETLYLAIDEKPKAADWRTLRRLRNIADNPRVAVVADAYQDADWSRLGFVLLRGRARVLEPPPDAEHRAAVAALRARYAQYRAMALEERAVVAIDVERVSTWGTLE